MQEHRLCRLGDLVTKCGPLELVNGRMRLCCTDNQLGLIPFSTLHSAINNHFISVRVGDTNVMSDGCARFDKIRPQVAKAKLSSKDIFVTVFFYQASPLDRTFIQANIKSIRQRDISVLIRENAVVDEKDCSDAALGSVLSKPNGEIFSRPLSRNGIKTGDAFLIGNLGSAIPIPSGSQRISSRSSSHYIPLFGPNSIIGRSLVVVETLSDGTMAPLACGNIERLTTYPDSIFASFTGYQNLDV